MRQRNAFTLIELLVVIAIIALLVSILLPSLRRAKELAIVVQCLSQERNMGTANLLYAEQSEGYSLPSGNWSSARCGLANKLFLDSLGIEAVYSSTYAANWSHLFWPSGALCPASGAKNLPHPTQSGMFLAAASWGTNVHGLPKSSFANWKDYFFRLEDVGKGTNVGQLSEKVFLLDHVSWESAYSRAAPSGYAQYGEFDREHHRPRGRAQTRRVPPSRQRQRRVPRRPCPDHAARGTVRPRRRQPRDQHPRLETPLTEPPRRSVRWNLHNGKPVPAPDG